MNMAKILIVEARFYDQDPGHQASAVGIGRSPTMARP